MRRWWIAALLGTLALALVVWRHPPRALREPRLYVKPVAAGCPGWLVVSQTPLEAFADDWRRYGARVALYNLVKTFTMRSKHGQDD